MQQNISGVINNMDNMEHLSLSTNNHRMTIFTENQRPTPNIFKCWGPQVPIFRRFNDFNASFPKIFQYDSSDSYSTHSIQGFPDETVGIFETLRAALQAIPSPFHCLDSEVHLAIGRLK